MTSGSTQLPDFTHEPTSQWSVCFPLALSPQGSLCTVPSAEPASALLPPELVPPAAAPAVPPTEVTPPPAPVAAEPPEPSEAKGASALMFPPQRTHTMASRATTERRMRSMMKCEPVPHAASKGWAGQRTRRAVGRSVGFSSRAKLRAQASKNSG